MEITFTINGNQDDPEGNPVPYVRSTRGALWRPDGKRYAKWKSYIQSKFYGQNKVYDLPIELREHAKSAALGIWEKPIKIEKLKAEMHIKIFWKNGAHGDPDNIFKGIADALFVNDKNLDGSFESAVAPDGKGRVEIKILIL